MVTFLGDDIWWHDEVTINSTTCGGSGIYMAASGIFCKVNNGILIHNSFGFRALVMIKISMILWLIESSLEEVTLARIQVVVPWEYSTWILERIIGD